MSEERLIAAIENLTRKMDEVSAAVGRGAPGTSSGSSKTGGKPAGNVNKGKSGGSTSGQDKLDKEHLKYTKKNNKATKDATDAQEDLTKEQKEGLKATKDLSDSYYSTSKNFKKFGADLLNGSGSLSTALGSLSSNFYYSGTALGKVMSGIAMGAGFMLGQMESFAKDAQSLGGYADLGAFKVGSIRQAKLMSGLGDAFIKSLSQSNGGFKSFGTTTQDAVENVSNLSRGFLTGSSYLKKSIRDNLGPELTKTVNETSKSIAALGLSQEDVAGVSGMLMSTIQFTAKSEKDAQQQLVKQFSTTIASSRDLSNAFGTSAQAMIETMKQFQNSAAGNLAALEGNTAAKDAYAIIKQLGIATSDEAAQKMALAMTEGNSGAALANSKTGVSGQMTQMLFDAVQKAGGTNANATGINQQMLGKSDQMNQIYENYGKNNPARYLTGEVGDQANVAGAGEAYMRRMTQAQKQTTANKGSTGSTTTEADNIKSMTTLSANIDSLRGAVNFLTAAIVGLTGAIGAVLVGGAIGGLIKGGGIGKIGEALGGSITKMFGSKTAVDAGGAVKDAAGKWRDTAGKFTKAPIPPTVPTPPGASAGMGGFGKWLEGMGSTGAMRGAGTLAILGGALVILATGLKVFNDVDWSSLIKGGLALGGLVVVANLLSGASAQILMGAGVVAVLGAAVSLSAYGFKMFNDVDWSSLVKGAVAIGGLALAMNLLAPAVPGMLFGSIALLALGASMFVFAKGIQEFNNVKWESVAKGIVAIAGLGVTMLLLSPALAVMALAAIPLIAFGAGLAVFALGIKQFNDVEWGSVGKGVAALAGLGLAVAFISPALVVMLAAAIPLVAFGAGLAVLAMGIEKFNSVDWSSLAKGSLALMAFGISSIALLPAVIPLLLLSVPLIAFGAALGIFADGIAKFNSVEWGSLAKGTLALAAFGIASIALLPAMIPLLLLSVPLIAFGAALNVFASGVEAFNNVEWGSLAKGSAALMAFGIASIFLLPALIPLALAAVPLIAFGIGIGIFALGIKQFNDVDWDSTFKGVVALGALGLAITGLGFLIPGIVLGSIAMGIMALAVGALGVALIPAAIAAKMFADAFQTISEIDGDNLIKIGAGLAAIGAGMIVFTAGMIAGTASSVITGIMSLFGAKSPLERIMEFVPYADAISKIGDGILHFGQGILQINEGLKDFDGDALSNFKDKLLEFAKAGSTNEVKLTADYLEKIGNALEKINNLGDIKLPNMADLTTPGVSGMDLSSSTSNFSVFGNAGGTNSPVTQEVIAQVLSSLSSIQGDLDAIRGNTRNTGADAPVRLG